MKIYRLTAWMMVSTNFAVTEFSEVRAGLGVVASCSSVDKADPSGQEV
jgi:hypothetical protein